MNEVGGVYSDLGVEVTDNIVTSNQEPVTSDTENDIAATTDSTDSTADSTIE